MNAEWIITVFVIVDELLTSAGHRDHPLAQASDAEVLTSALVAARFFQNHHERAVMLMQQQGYFSGALSISRFNRRLHALRDWLALALETLAELAVSGEIFIIDSLPLPVCKRARARRCRKVRGRDYCGYCAAKKEKFFGWRLHLIVNAAGVPVSYALWEASFFDLTPLHELAFVLPRGARLLGDKGYISAADAATLLAETGVRLITGRRKNMTPNSWEDAYELRLHRRTIETINSQLEKMGIERLYARTNDGFDIKARATILALFFTNHFPD